jgi:hypothetical protein
MNTADGILYGDVPYDTGLGGMGTLIYSTTGVTTGAVSSELFQNNAASFARVTGTTNVCDNNWHNLITTFDKAVGFIVYIDGNVETVVTDGTSPNVNYTTASNFNLGNGTNKSDTCIDANLALFQVWAGTTLTSANATAISAGGTNIASPTASWPFSEGSGLVATDSVASKTLTFNDGTMFIWSTDIPTQLQGSAGGSRMLKGVGS